MCCLGFLARACGESLDCINNVRSPSVLRSDNALVKAHSWLVQREDEFYPINSSACVRLMEVNDRESIVDREKQIIDLMAKHDIEVTFV